LTRGELLDGFPHRGQALRYLLQLLWVEGSGSRRFRRDVLWCSLRNGYHLLFGTGRWLRPADRDPTALRNGDGDVGSGRRMLEARSHEIVTVIIFVGLAALLGGRLDDRQRTTAYGN
jgi:hypothetical protein